MYSCDVYTKDDLQTTNVEHSLYKTDVKLPITLDILKVTIIIQLYNNMSCILKISTVDSISMKLVYATSFIIT